MATATAQKPAATELETFFQNNESAITFPKIGDAVKGTVVAVGRNEVRVDIDGVAVGIVRGPELDANLHLTLGDEIEATVIDLDNEFGELELSCKGADRKKAWDKLRELLAQNTVVSVKVLEANKGGLLVRLEGVAGFLPVSQLSPENYPRVAGGEKLKILEKLKTLVGNQLDVKVIAEWLALLEAKTAVSGS